MAGIAVVVLILGVCLPEALLAGMVLRAGEIDSGKVRVGAFAEVVYGKGARDPVSGEWEKLGRVSGYIKAVDAERLTLALKGGFGKKQIAFARIQKLLLAKSSGEMGRLKDALRRSKRPVSILQPSEGRGNGTRVVLKAGEIDSGKVRVGVFAAVVYGKGKRDPVSGEWEKLAGASGYVEAVDAERLILAVGGALKEQIPFARIQELIIAKSSREIETLKKATGVELPLAYDRRIAAKLGSGAMTGVSAGLVAAGLVLICGGANLPEGELAGLALAAGAAIFGGIGYVVGVPIGVSRVDPHDRFIASLAGSLIGGGVGYHIIRQQDDDLGLWRPSLLILPLVGAVTMSELTRKSPEVRRFSVGLAPGPDGSVSALATLRF